MSDGEENVGGDNVGEVEETLEEISEKVDEISENLRCLKAVILHILGGGTMYLGFRLLVEASRIDYQ